MGLQDEPRSTRVSIGAIIRDEGPYLLEWIAWHRCIGISDFLIADNRSADGTTELLRALDAAGIVRHLPFPGEPDVPPQLPAYRMFIERFGQQTDWIAFIDADEFIRPDPALMEAGWRLPQWLSDLPVDIGAVGMHWAVFGSSGRVEPGTGLVIERFQNRGPREFEENTHIKSIVRSAAWRGTLETPHGFDLLPGFTYIDTARAELRPEEPNRGRKATVTWQDFRLDHYAIKSRAEFVHKKVARGRPDTYLPEHSRDQAYFALYDANSVADPVGAATVARVKAEMELIRQQLRGLDPAVRDIDLTVSNIGRRPAAAKG